jgi:hypothetical protein
MVPQNRATLKSQPSSSQPIYLNGRVVGRVAGGIFRKSQSASKHFLRKPPAICFDRCTLLDAEASGAHTVQVLDQETGTFYRASLATIWTHYFPVQRGYGDQVGLGMAYWSVNGAPAPVEQRVAATNQETKALQLGLFGGAA